MPKNASPNKVSTVIPAPKLVDVDKIKQDLDRTLDELFNDVLPSTPYVRRLQLDPSKPTHQYPPQLWEYYWRRGSLWRSGEYELQYLTFNRNPDGILRSHGDWDDGYGGIAPSNKVKSHASRGQTPTQSTAVKKKISLADYKNRSIRKAVGENTTPTNKSPERDNDLKQRLGESPNVPGKIEDAASEVAAVTGKPTSEHHTGCPSQSQTSEGARSADKDTMIARSPLNGNPSSSATPSIGFRTPEHLPDNRPLKKRRVSSDSTSHLQDEAERKRRSLPMEFNKQNNHPLINGSLELNSQAPAIQVSSNDGGDFIQSTTSSPRSADAVRLPPMLSPTLPGVEKFKLPPLLSPNLPPQIEKILKEHRNQKVERHKGLNRTQNSHHVSSKSIDRGSSKMSSKSGQHPETTKGQGKPEKWIKIRIMRKAQRKILAEYLKPSPSLNVDHGSSASKMQSEDLKRKSASKTHTYSNQSDQKEDLSAPPRSIRKETQEAYGKTPNFPGSSPPDLSPPKAKRARKEPATSSGTVKHNRSFRDPGTPAGSSGVDQRKMEFRAEFNKVLQLAKDLKHNSDNHLKNYDQAAKIDQQLGICIATESILVYMLAAVVRNEPRRRLGDPGLIDIWKGILEFLGAKTEQARPYKHIYGLLLQLEGVTRDYIHYHHLFSIQNSVGHSSDETIWDLIKESNDNETRAITAWREGQLRLWVNEWQSFYPSTWNNARKAPSRGKAHDAVEIDAYGRNGFALPLTHMTSGLEAVNAGMAFLKEYCASHEVKWTPKLKI